MKNNLFTFATSELSQDAFICWCLNWINYPNEILYPMAKDIFSNLLKEEKNLENKEIEIRKQYKKIDVLVILKNSKKAYIIEDKTNTFENNQIIRYKEAIKNEIDIIKTVYFKTGFWFSDDDSVLADIKINREDFLGILNKYRGKNQILDDYCEYFERVTESEEKEKNYLISEEELTQKKYWELNIARSIIIQYQFMRYIFSKRYIRSDRSIGGGVYTQYDILKDKVFPDTKNENLSEDKRTYSVFWRIDSKDKIGPYISINFYTEHSKEDIKPRCREDEYKKLFNIKRKM
ncbi:hypothetical protein LDJ99_10510 [Fusobacterium nucleatum]|uniref:hypothetical protein n=1 Tax=Fusobacterium nucleatum TaxID=851 RepID=UPI0030D4A4DA